MFLCGLHRDQVEQTLWSGPFWLGSILADLAKAGPEAIKGAFKKSPTEVESWSMSKQPAPDADVTDEDHLTDALFSETTVADKTFGKHSVNRLCFCTRNTMDFYSGTSPTVEEDMGWGSLLQKIQDGVDVP
jgi:hypothetical protein